MKTGKIHLVFPDRTPVEAADLGDFLFLFRAAYAAALPIGDDTALRKLRDNQDSIEARFRRKLNKLNASELDNLFSKHLGDKAPFPQRISHESPLVIVISGAIVALTLAVILSGGKIKIDVTLAKVEAEIPAIGEGIMKLRQALTRRPQTPVGYGVKARRITLSREEFNELMRHDPESEKRGGFQRLLIGMQYRVNRLTRELDLSEHEIDIILHHGKEAYKGGWQSSIKKIFGNHFDLGAA